MDTSMVALRTKLVETERADEVAAHKAIASGAAMPKAKAPKAPKLADDLAEAEREVETVADLIVPGSRALLEASAVVALDVESEPMLTRTQPSKLCSITCEPRASCSTPKPSYASRPRGA